MLDKKDEILIEHLFQDCRISTSKLSKILRLSQSTVVYRIQKLEQQGYIGGYNAILNINRFNFQKEILLISVPDNQIEDFEKYITKNKSVTSSIRILNKYNYCLFCFFKNNKDKDNFHKYIEQYQHQKHKADRSILLPFSLYNMPIKNVMKIKKNKDIKLDKTDIEILKILCNKGGRYSILELNKQIQINYDTLLYKFKRLVKSGYLNLFTAQPGTKVFTLQYDILMIKDTDLSFEEIIKILEPIRQIFYIIELENNSYLTQIHTQNLEEYKEVLETINNKLREKITNIEVYNNKDYMFLHRYPLEELVKQ